MLVLDSQEGTKMPDRTLKALRMSHLLLEALSSKKMDLQRSIPRSLVTGLASWTSAWTIALKVQEVIDHHEVQRVDVKSHKDP